jgi:hypothetical protein
VALAGIDAGGDDQEVAMQESCRSGLELWRSF